MRVLLLTAAGAAVRGQLDAGLRSRIRFPPQLPGRHVVWEGHPRVGLGNVLAGWGDLYYKAIAAGDKTILVGLDQPLPRPRPVPGFCVVRVVAREEAPGDVSPTPRDAQRRLYRDAVRRSFN